MRVQVSYTMPVEVIVNLETGEVERVVEILEGTIPAPNGAGSVNADTYEPVSAEDEARAYELAESADEWPAWEAGF